MTSAGPHPAGLGLTAFARQLRQALPGTTLSATLPATSWYGNNYDGKIAEQVDWLAIETYDFTGSWNASPVGPHTALTKIRQQDVYAAEQQGAWPGGGAENNPILAVEDSLWYWTNPFYTNWQGPGQKLPRNRVLIGVPVYGYDFAYAKGPDPESGQIPPGYKVLRYKDILGQFPGAATAAAANIKVAGSTPRPAFTGASGDYQYAHNVYFETADSAVAKLNFAKNLGIAGVIAWELSSDAPAASLLSALYRNSGNPQTRPPIPTGFSTYTFTTKDKKNQISISVRDASITINGKDYPARLLQLPLYDGVAEYYIDGQAAVVYLFAIGNRLGRGLSLPAVMFNVLAQDARARNLGVIKLLNAQVLPG